MVGLLIRAFSLFIVHRVSMVDHPALTSFVPRLALSSYWIWVAGIKCSDFTGQRRLQGNFPPDLAVSAAAFGGLLPSMPRSPTQSLSP